MRLLFASALLFAAPALAAPRVATDIAPVHSIVTQVMEGIGQPDLLIQVGASPHGYSMRPSEAQALQDAEIVFWIGEALTPWLERGLDNLASDATVVELLGAGGSAMLPTRDAAIFDHDHHEDEHHDDHEKHDDDDDHAHEEGHDDDKHDEHDDEHEEHADEDGHDHHDHGDNDPHAWLDPENAKAWADLIAATLAAADPANAAAYAANAAATKARIDEGVTAISARLAPVRGKQFILFHDAYQYFERHFDMPSSGALTISDARKPSPARLAEIREHVSENDIACIFAEPQFNAGVVTAVAEGANVKTAIMDPLGSRNSPGAGFYSAMMDDIASSVVDCLSE